jgi:hypothetical protein
MDYVCWSPDVVSVSGVLPAAALAIAARSIYGMSICFTLSAANSPAEAAFGVSRPAFRPWIER